jgi:hypothetical protein
VDRKKYRLSMPRFGWVWAWLELIDIASDLGLLRSGLFEGLRDQGRTMDPEAVCMLGSIVRLPKLIQVPEFDPGYIG